MAHNRAAQQLIDLQNRITELSGQGRLDELTHGEVALISFALGRYSAELLQESRERIEPEDPMKSLATMRRAAKKAGFKA